MAKRALLMSKRALLTTSPPSPELFRLLHHDCAFGGSSALALPLLSFYWPFIPVWRGRPSLGAGLLFFIFSAVTITLPTTFRVFLFVVLLLPFDYYSRAHPAGGVCVCEPILVLVVSVSGCNMGC